MKRGTGLKRTTRLKPVNAKRKKKMHAEQFGPPGFADFVRASGCMIAVERVSSVCMGPVGVAHVVSRGAGGKWRENCVGLCAGHHAVQHAIGVAEFEKRHGVDMDLWACAITGKWEASL